MKKLYHSGQVFEAERIVKTEDSILGYIGNSIGWSFRGINDWSQFQLADGQEFDLDEKTEYQLALAELAETFEQEKTELQLALAELAEIVTGGN